METKRGVLIGLGALLTVLGFAAAYANENMGTLLFWVGLLLLGWNVVRAWRPESKWMASGVAFTLLIVGYGGAADIMPWHPFGFEDEAEREARLAREAEDAAEAARIDRERQAREAQQASEEAAEAEAKAAESRYFLLSEWTNEGFETVQFHVGTYDGSEVHEARRATATAQDSSGWRDRLEVPCVTDFSRIVILTSTVDGEPINKREFNDLACKGSEAPYKLRITASGRISLEGFNAD